MSANSAILTFVSFFVVVGQAIGDEHPTRGGETSLSPYTQDEGHLWNRLHRELFVRTDQSGKAHIHSTDPLLYRGGTFLFRGDRHHRAVKLLDEFLAEQDDRSIDKPLKRLFLQRDLWAAFDYAAWVPDGWVHQWRDESEAIALRTRLAKAVGRLSFTHRKINALPDNYAIAVKSMAFAQDYDPERPETPFLPSDLFDPSGPWVRFHDADLGPMAREHFQGAGGRAMHIIFLRLPGGRAATERYLNELGRDSVVQFPVGTMAAMVRRALAVDHSATVRITPITELVQIRVYRRIPEDPRANFHGDFGEQDGYEFVLDRNMLFAGEHGLRPVQPDEPSKSFARNEGDPFDPDDGRERIKTTHLQSCIQCHQAPGIHSITSMQRGLKAPGRDNFKTYDWQVEKNYTIQPKVQRFDWGLLQGMLEVGRTADNAKR